jgi:hypothetical protein
MFESLLRLPPRSRFVTSGWLTAVALAGISSGCVDTFDGVDIQATFDPGVLGAAETADDIQPGQPPPDTQFTLYAIDLVFRTDGGEVVVDENGEPIVDRSFAYGIFDFEIRSLIDIGSPCYIELETLEPRSFPGLHATRFAEKLRAVTGIDDPLNPPSDASEEDVIDILTADERVGLLDNLQTSLRAVVSTSTARPPEVDTGCVGDGEDTSSDLVPPPQCIDDESNERRLALCQDFWRRNPTYYEGSDRAFLDPINGTSYGLVDGTNPGNQQPLGGVEIQLDLDWDDFEKIAINWQYKDRDGDGEPDFPDELPAEERPALGFHYLEGDAAVVKRGVISYSMRNRTVSSIAAEISVLHSLGEDDVHF